MLWRDTALQINTFSFFTPHFLSLLTRMRRYLICVCAALGLFAAAAHADAVQATARTAEGRAMQEQLPGCTSAVSAGCAGTAPFQDVISLAEQGAPELALHIIDQQQTSIDPLAVEWAAWEKARILIYQQRRDWASVVRRTQALPDNLPLAFTRWVLTQGVAAQLESSQGTAARAGLLRLIWHPAGVDSRLFSEWRRMVIHSYIVDGRVDDAYIALLRYQQDYGEDVQTQLLQAHVLLLMERAAEAAALLAGEQEPAAVALHLLARLRSGGRPENILQEARQLLAPQPVTASQGLAAVAQAEAAKVIGDHERRVEAMEYVLALYEGVTPSAFAGLFNITDDSVWDAYVTYAQVLSNQQQLLMGDFAPWFAVAQSLAEEHPIRARALFAFLAMRADTVEIRLRAHQRLITLLGQLPQGTALTRALYIKLDRFH